MIREVFRELLSANLFVTGVLLTVASIVIFFGSVYLITYTNLGKKLAFLVTMTGIFGCVRVRRFISVMPSMPGMRTSVRRTSGWECSIASRRCSARSKLRVSISA